MCTCTFLVSFGDLDLSLMMTSSGLHCVAVGGSVAVDVSSSAKTKEKTAASRQDIYAGSGPCLRRCWLKPLRVHCNSTMHRHLFHVHVHVHVTTDALLPLKQMRDVFSQTFMCEAILGRYYLH